MNLNHKRTSTLINTILILGLAGCSHNYAGPESFREKMARFQGREKEYLEVPELPVLDSSANKLNNLGNKRSPASIAPNRSEDTDLSNKRLYFLTLYSQYLELSQWSAKNFETIKSCPHFHSTILGQKNIANIEHNQKSQILEKVLAQNIEKDKLALYPELVLPLERGPEMKSVYKVWQEDKISSVEEKSEILFEALNLHIQKLESEVKDLCSTGSSDNFYIFENLMTHFGSDSGKQVEPSRSNIGILLRTNIYTNMALITMLRDDKNTGASDYPMFQVYRRVGTNWMSQYYTAVKHERNSTH